MNTNRREVTYATQRLKASDYNYNRVWNCLYREESSLVELLSLQRRRKEARVPIELPREEFDILKDDEHTLVLYDKVVDKLYTFDKDNHGWKFPQGSRVDVIFKLTGLEL